MIRLTLVVLSLFLIAGRVAGQKKNHPVITVNGRAVYADELAFLFRKNYPDSKDHTTRQVDEYLNLYIRFLLKIEEARNRGLDTTRQFLREYETYRNELRKSYLHEERMLDSLVNLTYDRLKEEIRASHILIAINPEASAEDSLRAWERALEVRQRARQGEPFEELAVVFSDDPSVRINRGQLGYFTAMQMVYPFETAAYSGKPGDVVGPVRTRFGYHIIKIEDRQPARGEVEVSHIMLRNTPGRDMNQVRNTIFEIYEQLQGGVPWSELCTRYSEDMNSRNNDCRLRPFGVGAFSQAPEFEQVAFSLKNPGDISDPFQTNFGWHIIRLERKIPLPSLDELRTSLRNRVMRDERWQVARDRYYNQMRKRLNFQEHHNTVNRLLSSADSLLNRVRTDLPLTDTLATLTGSVITTGRFLNYLRLHQQSVPSRPAEYLRQIYNRFIESCIDEEVEKDEIRKNPHYRFLLKEYHEGILLFDIMEKEVWNKASEDTSGLRAYFEANRHRYQVAERVKAEIYAASSKEVLGPLYQYLIENDSVRAISYAANQRIRTEFGKFQWQDRDVLQLVPRYAGVHAAEKEGMYYLVRILEFIPPDTLSFDEARMAVVSDYQQDLENRWVEELKKKYPVAVHEKGRRQLLRMVRK
jgi:peptidyl-prolyl cis-trans isomerase SurA